MLLNRPASGPSCAAGRVTLQVVADPDQAGLLKQVTRDYASTAPVVGDRCVAVSVRSLDSPEAMAALAGGWTDPSLGPRPDVWVPASSTWASELDLQPWPLRAWPNVPTRFLLCRDDRLFPAEFMRRVVRERLGIIPDEIDGSHCVALSRPKELADRLEVYLAGRTAPGMQAASGAAQRYDRFVAPIMAPFVEALLDAANLSAGDAVLDVACGTGFTARAAAVRVGPTGRVVGGDINPGMLRVAATSSAATPSTIQWCQASADDLPFPDVTFDAVVCQQGLQFFPDPQAAVTEAARVTSKGGRIAATVWSPLERSPYFQALFRAVEKLVGPQASALFTDAFGCSPERVTAAFRAAGLSGVQAREVVADIRLPPIVEFVSGHLTATRWGVALADARRPDGVELATGSMVELLATRTAPDGSVTAPFASLLVTGNR